MLRVSFLIDGKYLEEMLTSISNRAYNLEFQPVANAEVDPVFSTSALKGRLKKRKTKGRRGKHSKVHAATNGSQLSRVSKHLAGAYKTGEIITSADVHKAMKAEHIRPGNIGYVVNLLKKGQMLRGDTKGSYIVLEKLTHVA